MESLLFKQTYIYIYVQDEALTREELAELRFQAAGARALEYEERGEAAYGKMFQGAHAYLYRHQSLRRWVVEGFLPQGYLAILGATSKAGKTCFATALAMAVAKGDEFLGMKTTPGAVLWCAYEENENERAEVLRQWKDVPNRFYVTHQKPLIDDYEGIEALKYWIYKTEAKLVVIDPLYGATDAESLSDGRTARQVLAKLKEVCRKSGVAALVIHHFTKDISAGLTRERFADSNQILATASMDLLMDAKDDPSGGRIIRINGRGRGAFANRSWLVRSTDVNHYELLNEDGSTRLPPTPEDRILAALAASPVPLTAAEIAEDSGIPTGTVRNRMPNLVQTNQVEPAGKRGPAPLYFTKLCTTAHPIHPVQP